MIEKSDKNETLPVLTSVAVVCRQFLHSSAEVSIDRLIESFVDTSSVCSLPAACKKSLGLVKRVLARMELNRPQIAAELCEAAGNGDVQAMKNLCGAVEEFTGTGTPDLLNERDFMGNSPLTKAVWSGSTQMLEWLVLNGANVEMRNVRGQTVLHQAAAEGKLAVVEWLVSQGLLPVDDKEGDGCTALLKAARNGRLPVAQWLVEHGALITERNGSGQTALHLSAGALRENVALVKFFVGNSLLVSDTDNWGNTALHYAGVARHFDTVEFFLKECYDEEKPKMDDLVTALFAASRVDEFMFIEYLLSFGVDLRHTNEQGRTALHEAAAGDAVEAAKTLLDNGVDVSQADNLGITPVIEASRCGRSRVLSCLLSAEWNTDDVDSAGRTALHHAAGGGHISVIDTLLYSADVNCCDKRGWTPLHCAAAAGRLEAVKMLKENGAALNVETMTIKTPLVLAIERGRSDVAQFLVEQSAVPEPLDSPPNTLENYVEYRLDPRDILFESPSLQESAKGSWLGSPIEVKVKKSWQSKNFVEELGQWSKLSHPNIAKLYGACYGDEVDDPYFVYERPAFGSLFEYFECEDSRAEVWDKLYEAALGLAYLHDRDIVHGDVSCSSIAIAGNGLAKVRNLGSKNDENSLRQNPSWTSPELLAGSPPTFESDVFAFGLTIVQAFKTTGDVWDLFGGARDEAIRSGKLPNKPDELSPGQWELVTQMCSHNPRDRPTASDVVRELEAFASKHESFQNRSAGIEEIELPLSWGNLGAVQLLTASDASVATIEDALAKIDKISSAVVTMNIMNRDVYERLVDVFDQLKARTDSPTIDLVHHLTSILRYFLSRLKSTRALGTRLAEIRQEADNAFSVHGEIDSLMDMAGLTRSTNVHEWRSLWELRRKEQIHSIIEKLGDITSLLKDVTDQSERKAALVYLRFEFANHPTSYFESSNSSDFNRAKAAIASLASSKNLNWFIPAYEVEFDRLDEFSSGAFGSVHRGWWNHARVVVKKLKLAKKKAQDTSDVFDSYDLDESTSPPTAMPLLEDIQATFLNEVEIWCELYHPSVVQLFGACHVGEPFFVCEFAGGGQLDKYLHSHPKEVWVKLYEAALGLRYLHAKHIVHGDLKCNNILIGDDGRAKLTDFGLSVLEMITPNDAEQPETELENNGTHNVGAIRWKAPEVLRGDRATFASDVYSFGMCILEAVSGNFPWGQEMDDFVVKYQVLTEKRIPQRPSNCSENAYQMVERMCRFDARERIAMNEVVDALSELCST